MYISLKMLFVIWIILTLLLFREIRIFIKEENEKDEKSNQPNRRE